jgi:glycosyltransferase involved in cell wall biosynthesis
MHLSLVVPAHDEALRIEPTLRAYRARLPDSELIVVANACTDDTAGVVRRLAAELGGIALIDIASPIGKGGAVRAGFARASGEYVGFADADLATPPEDVRRVLEAAAAGGAAIGSRGMPGSRVVGRTASRDLVGRVFAALARLLLGLPFHDTQCGIKIFHRRYLAEYLAHSSVSDLAFDVEMLVLLQDAGARIAEVGTTWTAKPGSATLGTLPDFVREGVRMVGSLLRLRARRKPRGLRSAGAAEPAQGEQREGGQR